MASQPERVILTYDDLLETPADLKRYEIIDGEMYVTAAPNTAHQISVAKLTLRVGGHVLDRDLGIVLTAPCDVYLSNVDIVEPDLLYVANARLGIVETQVVRGAPDLVIEIISPSTTRTDRQIKRQLYARYHVPQYWIVDPITHELTILAFEGPDYRVALQAKEDEIVVGPPPFPELTLPLGELWRWK